MEGFDLIATGLWSIVPPILALVLALITKEVYSSLTVGVFTGMVIYQFTLNGAGGEQLVASFTMVPQMMAEQIAGNGALLLFLALLGALTVVIATAGGSRAYAEWVTTHVKNARAASILTALLGIIIFVDDYFNCLTVGAVMRPVTDKFKVSHEKLAWIIDSTAAPVCIIAPVSSWAVAVGGYMGEDGFNTFVASIPYNFYALLTIFFVFFMLFIQKDFGPMAAAQAAANDRIPAAGSKLEAVSLARIADKAQVDLEGAPNIPTVVTEEGDIDDAAAGAIEEYKGLNISDRGTIWDLIVPILVLIVFSILGMMYMGGFFSGVDFATAVGENPVMGLCIGAVVALCVAAAMFLPRKLMNLGGFVEAMSEGVRSMIGAIMILVLAWSLGGCCRYLLGTGEFVSRGHLPGGGVHRVRHGHQLGHYRAHPAHHHRRVRCKRPAVPRGCGLGSGRRGVRRPHLAHLRHYHPVLGRCQVQPPAPRGHADSLCHSGHGHLLRRLHHRRYHQDAVDLPGSGPRAHRGGRARAHQDGGEAGCCREVGCLAGFPVSANVKRLPAGSLFRGVIRTELGAAAVGGPAGGLRSDTGLNHEKAPVWGLFLWVITEAARS